jgi:hypothetical protein
MEMLFLGKPPAYWVELDRRMSEQGDLSTENLLEEVAHLRGQISLLKSRIEQCSTILSKPYVPPNRR